MTAKKVIELIRVSTEGQAREDRASIPAQRAINRQTAKAYGLEIVRSIEMSDVSGAAVLHAPEIIEMLRIMESPEVHGIVTREFSRLMRPENFGDYIILQAFVDTQTLLYLPSGPIDLSSKQGRMMGMMNAMMAGAERIDIIQRSWDSKEEKRKNGKFPQCQICLPFGVGYDKERGWFYTEDAEKVKEAFRQFLAGQTNYNLLSRLVGVSNRGMVSILRNPIFTGWRVIDKKRDLSARARRQKPDGRQKDRPKIKRAPEEVIRVRVIDEPLISESDFARVQKVMDVKQEYHWKLRPDFEHRFTYNGFLRCSKCGKSVHTALSRDDYYICSHRKAKQCDAGYMRRDLLDPALDELFGERLSDVGLLNDIADAMQERARSSDAAHRVARLQSQIITLQARRGRVIDMFIEEIISKKVRDEKLMTIEREMSAAQDLLLREEPQGTMDAETLQMVFAAFTEWEGLTRNEKRRVLSILIPEIRLANYRVESLALLPPVSGMGSPTLAGSLFATQQILIPLNLELIS